MSLKKKIILSFIISFSMLAVFGVSWYLDFREIKEEVKYLELSDTIRSKSLQLRRHEKNLFLYGDLKEVDNVNGYISQLNELISNGKKITGNISNLEILEHSLDEYRIIFGRISGLFSELKIKLNGLKLKDKRYVFLHSFIDATFLEHPAQAAELIKKLSPENRQMIDDLNEIDHEIKSLRRLGDDILLASKDLDKTARENVEDIIRVSQLMAYILFPLSFIIGILFLFIITQGITKRLNLLMETVKKTGEGYFHTLPVPVQHDEVTALISTFNKMEDGLKLRDEELKIKEEELLQSKKLAAIGTLASGVAHELNNPLNNIYISAQALQREAGERYSPFMKETLNDIVSQSIRVKGIVADLLEFARGREPRLREVEINNLITGVYKSIGSSINLKDIKFVLDSDPNGIVIYADPEQMERVFINLFTNAVDAMNRKGSLSVKVAAEGDIIKAKVSDTGKGMSPEAIEKVFEPFFTTKDNGTGLGLAIVFNIINKHKGKISVESEEGKGAAFTIILPKMRG